ncbi:MAG TPA: TraR/DksA family transcriptional regulator [Verrucomicrobiae bacterium]|nr:TraR/DksA family transcriptional regulator [Verrucomicrobiae bacterium]
MQQPKNQFEVMRNMATMTRIPRKLFNSLEKQLASQRDELRRRIGRHRMDAVMDRELDDETAAAVENVSRDILAATLERERRTLKEIESALARMEKGEYGTCDSCGVAIPKARLDALPWARLCIHCAERSLNSSGLRVAF